MIKRRGARSGSRAPLHKSFYRHVLWAGGRLLLSLADGAPLPLSSWFFSRLFLLWYYVIRRHRRLAEKQLVERLGVDEEEARSVVRRMFVNLGRNFAEFVTLGGATRRDVERMVDGSTFLQAVDAHRRGRGVVVVTGHIGNWELLGAYSALHYPTTVIARRIYFPRYQEEVAALRRRCGIRVVYQDEGIRPALEALRRNHVLGILADQDLRGVSGVYTRFFGREAFTPVAPSALAQVTGAPLIVAALFRTGRLSHRIEVEGPFPPPKAETKEHTRLLLTQEWTSALERLVRRRPEQWAWFHPRWRTRPEKIDAPRISDLRSAREPSSAN